MDIENILAENLVKSGLIEEEQLQYATRQKYITGKDLEEVLVEEGWIKVKTIIYLKENLISLAKNKNQLATQDSLKYNNLTINLSAKYVFKVLLTTICFFLFANLLGQFSQYFVPDFFLRDSFTRAFNLDGELNIPAVYSALTLLLSSIILSFISYIKNSRHDPYTNYWRGLSIIFAFLFFDELASLHETMVEPVRTALNTRGILYFAWVIPGSIGVLIFLLIFLKFIINLPPKTRKSFVIAGTTYIAGTIGCELIGGYISDVYTEQSIFYVFAFSLEEFLEMLGVTIFIYGLLSHISSFSNDSILTIKIPTRKLKTV
ncbi:hypothetical protein [Calothrix sp. PCC 6303]|uniref:hypothetical protein n=1 Tax=Calothrix sp. PCC 6303 TaxID=1170562 RepID=UPI0002A0569B|nr:hypothetical protein [Calothrix sp. PCC 6303]AFZ01875.1 hypothetical protein Cal6303_2924 [Calothrix sp. PCC 6303]